MVELAALLGRAAAEVEDFRGDYQQLAAIVRAWGEREHRVPLHAGASVRLFPLSGRELALAPSNYTARSCSRSWPAPLARH